MMFLKDIGVQCDDIEWDHIPIIVLEVCMSPFFISILYIDWLQSLKQFFINVLYHILVAPGRVEQSITCLATYACLTADPGVASSIPVRSHTFVEIDHEIISTVILLPSADSFKKGCCQLQVKVCACTNYWLTTCSSLPRKKVWLGELTVPQ